MLISYKRHLSETQKSVPYPQSNHPRVVHRTVRQSLKFLWEFWNNTNQYLVLVELCTNNISKPSKEPVKKANIIDYE